MSWWTGGILVGLFPAQLGIFSNNHWNWWEIMHAWVWWLCPLDSLGRDISLVTLVSVPQEIIHSEAELIHQQAFDHFMDSSPNHHISQHMSIIPSFIAPAQVVLARTTSPQVSVPWPEHLKWQLLEIHDDPCNVGLHPFFGYRQGLGAGWELGFPIR